MPILVLSSFNSFRIGILCSTHKKLFPIGEDLGLLYPIQDLDVFVVLKVIFRHWLCTHLGSDPCNGALFSYKDLLNHSGMCSVLEESSGEKVFSGLFPKMHSSEPSPFGTPLPTVSGHFSVWSQMLQLGC